MESPFNLKNQVLVLCIEICNDDFYGFNFKKRYLVNKGNQIINQQICTVRFSWLVFFFSAHARRPHIHTLRNQSSISSIGHSITTYIIFPFFDHLPMSSWKFFTLKVDNNWHFRPLPADLVNVVSERASKSYATFLLAWAENFLRAHFIY